MPDTPIEERRTNLEITHDPTICRMILLSMVEVLNAGPKSRCRSIAITKLDEARLWLGEAMRVDPIETI